MTKECHVGRAQPALFSANRIAGLWCRLVGHNWQPVLPGTHASVMQICLRCRENGWRLL